MGGFRNRLQGWAEGSVPTDQNLYSYIYKEYSWLFAVSCWFPDLRPKYRALSIGFCLFSAVSVMFHLCMFIITAYKQKSDLAAASLSANIVILDFLNISMTLMVNAKRDSLISLFRASSQNFFDYGDGEEISEMQEESRKSRRQKIFVLTVQPVYLFLTAAVAMARRTIDFYVGDEGATYVDDIYTLTPLPLWYPFRISNGFLHYFTSWWQIATATMDAVFFTVATATQVVFMQALMLQLKILKYRIRKLRMFAYKRHMAEGGKSLTRQEMFRDQHFLKKYNECMNLCASHHINIITNFNHLQELYKWPMFILMLTLSIMICGTLVLFIVGGKASAIALGSILFFDEMFNFALMCWQTEQVTELAASLHEELYDIDWTDLDGRAKRTMMIMIERSKQPLVLSAAVIKTPINWETYSKVVNTAYSYFNVLSATV